MDEEEADRRTTERALAADVTVQRTLTLTRHTVHRADATATDLWDVHVHVTESGRPAVSSTCATERWLYSTEADAHARLETLDDDLPPLVKAEEAAAILGTTRDALGRLFRILVRRSPRGLPAHILARWTKPKRAVRCGGTRFACVRRLSWIGMRWHGLSRWTQTLSKSSCTSARRIPKCF
ncbi:hypothetical protein M1P56_16995 [Streptomyces sp. HU2014]|uniref:hypothetical protein n=1 Tax=Streptomyces sp. HU2014 TaxID=2939414 RepID=UPI00200DCEA6|nr:hypothetical protein [Streptomyces sp. HU2014]UQI45931.1 hypothetical protein M1P56_16995 [Streptomyces sp. HU2014]